MTRLAAAALALSVVLSAGCHDTADMNGSTSRPATAMTYFGYDNSGRLIVSGWIDLGITTVPAPPVPPSPAPSLDYSGSWHLCPAPDPGSSSCQSGVLAWGFVGNGIGVQLHPGVSDDSYELMGVMTAQPRGGLLYEGTWHWQGVGSSADGTFRAAYGMFPSE